MKALLLTEYGRLTMTDMDVPEVGAEDVLVRVRACGICGSDIHGYTGKTGRRIPPLVMGHEAAGVVERTGAAVPGVTPGHRGTFDSPGSCGRRARGWRRIGAVDRDAARRERAVRLGAGRAAENLSGVPPADHAFEVGGPPATVAAAINSVRKGGAVTLVGNLAPEVPLPLQTV